MASRTILDLVLVGGEVTRKYIPGTCPKFNLQSVEWPNRSTDKHNARNPTTIRKYAPVDMSVERSGDSLRYDLQETKSGFVSTRAQCARARGGK